MLPPSASTTSPPPPTSTPQKTLSRSNSVPHLSSRKTHSQTYSSDPRSPITNPFNDSIEVEYPRSLESGNLRALPPNRGVLSKIASYIFSCSGVAVALGTAALIVAGALLTSSVIGAPVGIPMLIAGGGLIGMGIAGSIGGMAYAHYPPQMPYQAV